MKARLNRMNSRRVPSLIPTTSWLISFGIFALFLFVLLPQEHVCVYVVASQEQHEVAISKQKQRHLLLFFPWRWRNRNKGSNNLDVQTAPKQVEKKHPLRVLLRKALNAVLHRRRPIVEEEVETKKNWKSHLIGFVQQIIPEPLRKRREGMERKRRTTQDNRPPRQGRKEFQAKITEKSDKTSRKSSKKQKQVDNPALAQSAPRNVDAAASPVKFDCSNHHANNHHARKWWWDKFKWLGSSSVYASNSNNKQEREQTENAYRMAILSSMAYWDFGKRALPRGVSGFELLPPATVDNRKRAKLLRLFKRQSASIQMAACQSQRTLVSGAANMRYIVERYYQARHRIPKSKRKNKNKSFASQQHELLPNQSELPDCQTAIASSKERRYDFQWYLQNFHEPTPLVARWHDTDVLVATSASKENGRGDTLVLSFSGTSSAADALTNVQTFEPVRHSGLFSSSKSNKITGSIHRGFLNAYSRVERGKVTRLCNSNTNESGGDLCKQNLTRGLQKRYGHCYDDDIDDEEDEIEEDGNSNTTNTTNKSSNLSSKTKKTSGRRKCRAHGERLMEILRELVNSALLSGNNVELAGHSLGGGLATLLALDILINFPYVPVDKLQLWTFGAPEFADATFLQSAMKESPRFKAFIQNTRTNKKHNGRRYHRYVTLSDDCVADAVSTIASTAVPSDNVKRGLYGRLARRLGGVDGGVVHIAEPHFLYPPSSALSSPIIGNTKNATTSTNATTKRNSTVDDSTSANDAAGKNTANNNNNQEPVSTTNSALNAHTIVSYLQGISRESPHHPLRSNLPKELKEFIGETA